MGNKEFGIDLETIKSITKQISLIYKKGIKISLVVGGGNIFRGISASSDGMDRTSADYTGMLATVINSLILQNSLEQKGIPTRVLSAIKMDTVCESYIRRRAIRHIEKKKNSHICSWYRKSFFHNRHCSSTKSIRDEM